MTNRLAPLVSLLSRHAPCDGTASTVLARVHLIRSTTATEPIHVLHRPAVCWVVQGRKQTMLGAETHLYGPPQFLIVSAELPLTGQILDATPDLPYLCVRLDLDPTTLSGVIDEARLAGAPQEPLHSPPQRGVAIGSAPDAMLDTLARLVALLDAPPPDQRMLAPLAERELLYRLLQSDQAARLRQIALADSKLSRINRTIAWIKTHYASPVRVDEMAALASMSASSFHEHFRTITAMSPLQYVKQIRLQQARHLMLVQALDAATASFHVGYESPSQFSRDYARRFGLPPRRDIDRMRDAPRFG